MALIRLCLACFCKNYLFSQPRQLPCGDRICGECFQSLLSADDSRSYRNYACDTCVSAAIISSEVYMVYISWILCTRVP